MIRFQKEFAQKSGAPSSDTMSQYNFFLKFVYSSYRYEQLLTFFRWLVNGHKVKEKKNQPGRR